MNKNNLTLQQQLKDIGAKLHQIRVSQNITLKTVAAKTLISQRLLEAIEVGDLAELPEPFYIQALVKKYATAVGAPNIAFKIERELSDTVANSAQNRRRYWLNFQLRSRHLYLLYILLVVVSARGITSLVERPVVIEQPVINNPELELIPETEPVPTAKITQPDLVPQFVSQSSNSELVSVGINLQERCWLKVMVDGNVSFEGVLPKGTKRQWSGKEVTIKAGNAGGVVVSFNNQQQQILGAPGQVEEITYTVN